MTTAIFIVIFARNKWWIDLNGQTKGPFASSKSAEIEAVYMATQYARDGRAAAEVQVVEPGQKRRIAYQSTGVGILGRAAALTNH